MHSDWKDTFKMRKETDIDPEKDLFQRDSPSQKWNGREYTDLFYSTLDHMDNLIFLLERYSGEIIYTNAISCSRLGYSRDEVNAKNIETFLPKRTSKELFKYFVGNSNFRDDHSRKVVETSLRTSEGNSIPVEITCSKVSFNNKEYALLVGRDLSELKKSDANTNESKMQYRITINSIKEALVVVDSNLRITIYNKAFEQLCNLTGNVCTGTGRSIHDVVPFLAGALSLEYRYISESGRQMVTRVSTRTPEPERESLTFEVTKTPIYEDGELARIVTVIRDITEEQRIDNLKQKAFEQIEKNMEQFAILNDHIRNPLQTIVGLADLEGGEFSDMIINQAEEIDNIIKKLDMGWIESDKIREVLSKHYGIKAPKKVYRNLAEMNSGKLDHLKKTNIEKIF